MSKAQRAVIALLSIIACVLLILVGRSGLQVYSQWANRPLGPSLPTSAYIPQDLPAASTPATRSLIAGAYPVTPTTGPRCGGPAVMTVLLIGSDTRSTGYTWGLADVIRIARIDFATPRVSVLDFPRDLWVEIPEISDNLNGQDHEKLNQAYLYGNPGDGFGYWHDPSAGPGLLARTLDLNFGVKVDHYLAVNMQTFVRMVDALGGIDVVLKHSVAGSDNVHLQAGRHHLDGAEALALARDRGRGVFDRNDNQNLVLCAVRAKLTSPSILPRIPEMVRSFQGAVQTDLDPKLMGQLACLAAQTPVENLALYSFPEAMFAESRVYDPVFEKNVFVWDYDGLVMRNYVAQFQSGEWPDSPGEGESSGSMTFCE